MTKRLLKLLRRIFGVLAIWNIRGLWWDKNSENVMILSKAWNRIMQNYGTEVYIFGITMVVVCTLYLIWLTPNKKEKIEYENY